MLMENRNCPDSYSCALLLITSQNTIRHSRKSKLLQMTAHTFTGYFHILLQIVQILQEGFNTISLDLNHCYFHLG